MRTIFACPLFLAFGVIGLVMIVPGSAVAKCKTFSAYYNGTDIGMGAAHSAEQRMRSNVASWAKQNNIKHYHIRKVKKACGEWYFTPLLPHHKCTATARVCY
ncbi:MAG: hypothetical protein IIB62_05645 [Proteobacteria bacterium]|nr:hypothetical protein [Pseudomonadota bacterium]